MKNAPRWTESQDAFLRKYATSLHWTSLAHALGRSELAIRSRIFRLQIPYLPHCAPETVNLADVEGEAPPRVPLPEKVRRPSRSILIGAEHHRPQGFAPKQHGAECSNPECGLRVAFVHCHTGECLKCAVLNGTIEEESPKESEGNASRLPKVSDETIHERIKQANQMRDDLEVCRVQNAMIHMHPKFAEFAERQPA